MEKSTRSFGMMRMETSQELLLPFLARNTLTASMALTAIKKQKSNRESRWKKSCKLILKTSNLSVSTFLYVLLKTMSHQAFMKIVFLNTALLTPAALSFYANTNFQANTSNEALSGSVLGRIGN